MKKILFSLVVATSTILQVKAGGLVTNSNQSASYYRMLARGASISGDAVYYNPAGLAFLDKGLTISLNTQMIWMQRTINNDFPALKTHLEAPSGALRTGEFIGNLYVPVFPGVYAAYKTGNWTFSLGFNPPAGGGSVEFEKGLPMLELPVSVLPATVTAAGIPTTNYSMNSMLKGSSIVYGVQAGASYRINDMIGVFGGVRMLFASNSYEGYLKDIKINPNLTTLGLGSFLNGEMIDATQMNAAGDAILAYANTLPEPNASQLRQVGGGLKVIASQIPGLTELDVVQKGSGIAPIIGVHVNVGNLNLAAKYEFNAKITIKNETKKNAMDMYPDGLELRSDVPALLSLAGSYDILPALRLSVTYLHHFEPQATIESWVPSSSLSSSLGSILQRQDLIKRGTNEYQAGMEWKITDKLTLSTGCQYSDVSVSNDWQNDIAHNLDNFTWGLGAAYQLSDRLTLNIGGLYTWYTPVSVKSGYTQTYDRTNKALALGIDFHFGKKKVVSTDNTLSYK